MREPREKRKIIPDWAAKEECELRTAGEEEEKAGEEGNVGVEVDNREGDGEAIVILPAEAAEAVVAAASTNQQVPWLLIGPPLLFR